MPYMAQAHGAYVWTGMLVIYNDYYSNKHMHVGRREHVQYYSIPTFSVHAWTYMRTC